MHVGQIQPFSVIAGRITPEDLIRRARALQMGVTDAFGLPIVHATSSIHRARMEAEASDSTWTRNVADLIDLLGRGVTEIFTTSDVYGEWDRFFGVPHILTIDYPILSKFDLQPHWKQPKPVHARWVVRRTFGPLDDARRLSGDKETAYLTFTEGFGRDVKSLESHSLVSFAVRSANHPASWASEIRRSIGADPSCRRVIYVWNPDRREKLEEELRTRGVSVVSPEKWSITNGTAAVCVAPAPYDVSTRSFDHHTVCGDFPPHLGFYDVLTSQTGTASLEVMIPFEGRQRKKPSSAAWAREEERLWQTWILRANEEPGKDFSAFVYATLGWSEPPGFDGPLHLSFTGQP